MSRRKQSYDHRLRDLVRSTGDITLATVAGLPASTARGWLHCPARTTVTTDALTMSEKDLRTEVLRLRGHHSDGYPSPKTPNVLRDSTIAFYGIPTVSVGASSQTKRTPPGGDVLSVRVAGGGLFAEERTGRGGVSPRPFEIVGVVSPAA